MKNLFPFTKTGLIIGFLISNGIFSTRLWAQCNPVSDSLALVAFYNATDGGNWNDNSNWLVEEQSVGSWFGVTVNDDGCVIEFNIINNNLNGYIPPEIGNLSNLVKFRIAGQGLTGNIPVEFENLTQLQELNLSQFLTGELTSVVWFLPQLKIFTMYGNDMLTGSIPPEIENLTNLEFINFQANSFSGVIPPEIGNLDNLKQLWISGSNLSGTIPPEIGNLSNLIEIHLQSNGLSGTIPSEIGNLSNLKSLGLSQNQLTGNIPFEVINLSHLIHLVLNGNQITGGIPVGIGNLSELEYLGLANNPLMGGIPPEIGNLENLEWLELKNCQLTGSIPKEILKLSNLIELHLGNNQLTGKLPIGLTQLTHLNYLLFSNNQLSGCFPPGYSSFCGLEVIDFTGNPGLPNGGDFDSFCVNETGECDPTIIGKIIEDENLNCIADPIEPGLNNWMIVANSDEGTQYGLSDQTGNYSIYTNPGEFSINLIPLSPYWEENCTNTPNILIENNLDVDTVSFSPQAIMECPFLTVDISTPFLRRCFSNVYEVSFCNHGTMMAEDAYIRVYFPPLINVDSTSIPISEQFDNTFTFELGDVPIGYCGSFLIHTNVSCNAELGQTLCATVNIYPNDYCGAFSQDWSGANVVITGECTGNEVLFTFKNTGFGDMETDQTYIIVDDGISTSPQPVPFSLGSGEEFQINLDANGSTFGCVASQIPGHPGGSIASAFVEACGTNDQGGFSTGYVTQYPEDDNSSFVSVDCQEVIGSFDPNDKRGFPKGYGEEHFIERSQDIEYHIRFQNTGTDTAFTVVVEDVLSPHLEMTSLRLGASSHPYTLEILGSNTLKFIFTNILLPDSITNESSSNGFLKFKISQKQNLPIGTIIENEAAIFFDFNIPVITNTTFHTIGENFIESDVNQLPLIPDLEVSVAPNPVSEEAVIRINGIDFYDAQFKLYNSMGILLKQESFSGNEFLLEKGDLPEGIYFFEIVVDGKKGFIGKLVVD